MTDARVTPRVAVALAAGAVAGCGARTGPVAARAPTSAATAPAAVPAVETPDPRWLADLEAELTALRGLPFRRRVPFATQTRDSFRADVRAELSRDLPAQKAADLSRAYAAFGFVEPGFDLSKALEEMLATQVAAYYDPRTRAFKVVKSGAGGAGGTGAPPGGPPATPLVVAHELVHALQDQTFDLLRFDGESGGAGGASGTGTGGLDDDEKLTRRFVTEGEATFLMMARELGSGARGGRRLGPLAVAGLRMNIAMLAAADMLDLMATMRQGRSAAALDAEARAELAALERLPPLITLPLVEPYLKGAAFISEVWAAGGWTAVDDVYRHPPQSTEQALHPAEKFVAHRDPPVRVGLPPAQPPPSAGARLLTSEVVGELGWRIYFRTWHLAAGEQAAAGWGGDRFWAWEAGGGGTSTLAATIWDSEAEAARFADAYETTLAARFPKTFAAAAGPGGFRVTRPGGGPLAVERRGRCVDVFAAAGDAELAAVQATARALIRDPCEAGKR